MPAGYAVGMQVFFTGPSFKVSSNNWLVQGAQGEVVGPATSRAFEGKGVSVQFPKNRTPVECDLNELSRSREPPSIHLSSSTNVAVAVWHGRRERSRWLSTK